MSMKSSIGGYKGPTMYEGEHESSICGYKGPTMYRGEHESSICGYKGPTMFWPRPIEDFGSGLGEFRDFPGPQHLICVSLGASQVH